MKKLILRVIFDLEFEPEDNREKAEVTFSCPHTSKPLSDEMKVFAVETVGMHCSRILKSVKDGKITPGS